MDIKNELLKFNDFLNSVYGRPIKLSDILNSNSFSVEEINIIKEEIELLLLHLEFALKCKFINSSNKLRLYQVICKRYGLFGFDKLTLREVAKEMNLSHERVRQLEEKAINYIKPNKRGDFLSMAISLSACQILNIDVCVKLAQDNIEE